VQVVGRDKILIYDLYQLGALEFGQYLEQYLWPHFNADASRKHVLSIVLMVNQKFIESSDGWQVYRRSNAMRCTICFIITLSALITIDV
jgi:hypothetical protein